MAYCEVWYLGEFLFLSHHRQHKAHHLPRWPPHCHLAQRALRAALQGCEGDAVAAGGEAEGAWGEEGRWDLYAAHPQSAACAHGPLHLPGGEHPRKSLHLRLCKR